MKFPICLMIVDQRTKIINFLLLIIRKDKNVFVILSTTNVA